VNSASITPGQDIKQFFDLFCGENAENIIAKMENISHVISVGAHHDSITATSKEYVHVLEKQEFQNAITKVEKLL